jgi:pyridoxine kinase
MTPEMVERLRWLAGKADCITPNFTEAAMQRPDAGGFRLFAREAEIKDWLRALAEMGPVLSVITSVPLPGRHKGGSAVMAYDRGQRRFWKVDCEYIPAFYPGTGDAFTSVLTACLLRGENLPLAMDRAAQFVALGIRATFGHALPQREGILLERVLSSLHAPLITSSYELLEG